MYEIGLKDIKFFAKHGVYEEERKRGTQFAVDLHMEVKAPEAAASDDLSHTLDYQDAYKLVLEISTQRVQLLETIAHNIASSILDRFPAVMSARVRVKKRQPLGMPQCKHAYVEIVARRPVKA